MLELCETKGNQAAVFLPQNLLSWYLKIEDSTVFSCQFSWCMCKSLNKKKMDLYFHASPLPLIIHLMYRSFTDHFFSIKIIVYSSFRKYSSNISFYTGDFYFFWLYSMKVLSLLFPPIRHSLRIHSCCKRNFLHCTLQFPFINKILGIVVQNPVKETGCT